MRKMSATLQSCALPTRFALVSGLGFVTDAVVLHLLMGAAVPAAWARVVSLLCAMQVTFVVNCRVVFRGRDRTRPWRQWATYMLAHGVGNACNYWIFVTLVSLHRAPFSVPLVALGVASVLAWTINYLAARYLVFRRASGRTQAQAAAGCVTPLPVRRSDGREPV